MSKKFEILLMDSTHTTLSNIPITTLLTVTYAGFGVPVGFLISTNEDTMAYSIFLRELFSNGNAPDAIMVDKSDAEIKAIRSFGENQKVNTVVVICYFHVLQAIQRYFRSHSMQEQEMKIII